MFEILEHTGDIRIGVRADSLDTLYQDAVRGLMATLIPREASRPDSAEQRIELESADPTCLLVDFLNEVLWKATSSLECYERVQPEMISDHRIVATVHGRTVEGFSEEIKAVTYHEAEVRREGDVWLTNLVLDV